MAYNAQAETYAVGAREYYPPAPYARPTSDWCLFDQVYSEIADVTPTERSFVGSTLVGKLPTIQHLAPKTQREIIAVVLRDMQKLPPPADRLKKVQQGVFIWDFSQDEERC